MKDYTYSRSRKTTCTTPCWIAMINELHEILGFSWARIAYRIGSSPSSIQKLVKDFNRIPRDKMFFALACYYHKLFYSEYSMPKAKNYVEANHDQTLCNLVIELFNRGFLDDFGTTPSEQESKKKLIESAQKKGFLGKEDVNVGGEVYQTPASTTHIHLM